MNAHVSRTDSPDLLDRHFFRLDEPRPLTDPECRYIRHKACGLHKRGDGALGALLIGLLEEADAERRDHILQLVSRHIRLGDVAADNGRIAA